MVTETFGDILFISGSESFTEFPSPELLKRKIIISTKPPKEYVESKNLEIIHNTNEHKEKKSSEEKAWGTEFSNISKKMEVVDMVFFYLSYSSRSHIKLLTVLFLDVLK